MRYKRGGLKMEVQIRQILLASDGSENARKAVFYGIELAKLTGARVHALYVISDKHATSTRKLMGWTEAVEKYLLDRGEIATSNIENIGKESGVQVKSVFLKGDPAKEILAYVEKTEIDLIVIGSLGLTGIKKFLLGSVAEKVLRHSNIPVMVVR